MELWLDAATEFWMTVDLILLLLFGPSCRESHADHKLYAIA